MDIYHQLICGGGRREWLCRSWVDRSDLRASSVVVCRCARILWIILVNWLATKYTKIENRKYKGELRSDTEQTGHAKSVKGNMRGSTAGLAEGIIASPNTIHATFLVFLDILFASLIVAPAVINYWRGTWNLMAYVLFPNDMLLSAIASSVLAAIGNFVLAYGQEKFTRTFHPDKHRVTFFIFSRCYSLVFGLISVNSWRGIWMLMDVYVPYNVQLLLLVIGLSLLVMAFCKGLRNISSQPFTVSTDHSKDYFVIPTMLKSSVRVRFVVSMNFAVFSKWQFSTIQEYLSQILTSFFFAPFVGIQRARILFHRLRIFSVGDWFAGGGCVARPLGCMRSSHLSRSISRIGMGIRGKYLVFSNVRKTKFYIDVTVNRTGTILDLRHFEYRAKYELIHKWNQEIIQ